MNGYGDYWSYGIVPLEIPGSRQPAPAPAPAPSYETPWWVDTINRGIERAAQVASLEVAGYPEYPEYPTPSPRPVPLPAPAPGVVPQQREGIQLSQTTLMLLVGGVLLFMLGGRRGR